jgi:hypothetical protein
MADDLGHYEGQRKDEAAAAPNRLCNRLPSSFLTAFWSAWVLLAPRQVKFSQNATARRVRALSAPGALQHLLCTAMHTHHNDILLLRSTSTPSLSHTRACGGRILSRTKLLTAHKQQPVAAAGLTSACDNQQHHQAARPARCGSHRPAGKMHSLTLTPQHTHQTLTQDTQETHLRARPAAAAHRCSRARPQAGATAARQAPRSHDKDRISTVRQLPLTASTAVGSCAARHGSPCHTTPPWGFLHDTADRGRVPCSRRQKLPTCKTHHSTAQQRCTRITCPS